MIQATAVDLHVAIGRLVRRLRQLQEPGDIRLTEVSVLARLDRGGDRSASSLAEIERVTPQAMSETVALLEQAGYLRRRPDENDGRRSVLSVTTKGKRLLTSRRTRSTEVIHRAIATALTADELTQLLAAVPLLEKLADAL